MSLLTVKLKISMIIAVVLLSACASQSAYKPANGSGFGYKESQISANQYRVQFKARGDNRGKAVDYALLRAAELTLMNGYDWFVVVDRETVVERDQEGVQTTATTQTVVTRDCGLLTCNTNVRKVPNYGVEVDYGNTGETETSLGITMGKGVRPANGDSYDATEVRDNLKKRI
jgi:hypothetical protein